MIIGDGMKQEHRIEEYAKEYTMFSGNKGSEENAIAATFIYLINNNKFDSIDDALKYNGNSYKTFMKNNRRDNIPAHYGNNITDADFKLIVDNFKKMVNDKLKFDKDKIHELDFENKEYVEYDGHVLDNSLKDRPIEEELRYMQRENPEFQSLNSSENTDKMMDVQRNEKKREVEFTDLSDIDRDKLNSEEQRLFDAALIEERVSGKDKDISIEDGLIKDDDNNINQIKEEGNSITFASSNSDSSIEESTINPLSAIDEESLTDIEKEIYNAAKKYQDITGELIRLDLKNMFIVTPYNDVKEIITKNGVLVVDDDRLLSQEQMTNEEEKEQEMENVKVKKLEFPKPFSNYNLEENAA